MPRITLAHIHEHLLEQQKTLSKILDFLINAENNSLRINDKIFNIEIELNTIASLLTHNKKQLKQMATSFNDEMDLLLAKVSQENTDIASMKAFIDNLKGQVVVQLDLTPEQQAKADELFSNISSNDQAILDAINTTPAP